MNPKHPARARALETIEIGLEYLGRGFDRLLGLPRPPMGKRARARTERAASKSYTAVRIWGRLLLHEEWPDMMKTLRLDDGSAVRVALATTTLAELRDVWGDDLAAKPILILDFKDCQVHGVARMDFSRPSEVNL